MELSEIVNVLLGGGLMATTVAIVTLKSTIKEANAKAETAMADAERVRIGNTESATRILMENIVDPLKTELDETRRAMQATKREMSKLRKAIDTANSCRHHDDCPVLIGLRKQQEGTGEDNEGRTEGTADRQLPNRVPRSRSKAGAKADDTDANGENGTYGGQPPEPS